MHHLSPHYDDVCFSIGHVAGSVATVNLFTLGVAAEMDLPADEGERVKVVRLRRGRILLFRPRTGAARPRAEPALMVWGPDLTDLDIEVSALSAGWCYLLAMLPSQGD
jgi:hypothetical protein